MRQQHICSPHTFTHTFPPIQPFALCCEPPKQNLSGREVSMTQGKSNQMHLWLLKCSIVTHSLQLEACRTEQVVYPLPALAFHGTEIKSDQFHCLCVPEIHYSEDIVMHDHNFVETIRTHKFAITGKQHHSSRTPSIINLFPFIHSPFSVECCICVLFHTTS